jgi:tetratricopeptide (TPR) repeat protein
MMCGATASVAATVVVRSGEHDGFTRVVLHLPTDLSWQSSETGDGVLLEFADKVPEFNLSQAFTRIGRDRIASITRANSGVAVAFGCACTAKVYANGSRMIVVDVSPGKNVKAEKEATETLPDPAMVLARSKRPQLPTQLGKELTSNTITEPIADPELARRRLMQQLGRAASMGLVELTIPDEHVDKMGQALESKNETGMVAHQAGLDAVPVVSPEISGELTSASVSEQGVDCPDDLHLDTGSWVQGENFTTGLYELRSQLGGEIVEVETTIALQLVRHYIAFGFGAEARSILDLVDETPSAKWLRPMADIVSEKVSDSTMDFSRFASCKSAIAMWAFLAADKDTLSQPIDAGTILRAFNDLTEPLQDILAPRLGSALLALGEEDAAQAVLRLAQRRTTPSTANLDHLGAQIHERSGEHDEAKEKLVRSVQSDAPISPIALAELIENEVRLGRTVDKGTVDLLASYYQQYRRDDIAPRLLTVLILANALAGQFEESWSLLESAPEDIRRSQTVRSGFAKALADHASDLDTMRYATILARRATRLEASANQVLAERLLAIGFPDLARKFLSVPEQGPAEHDRKLLLAKLALNQHQTVAAKAHLLGLAGPEVDALLGQILSADNDRQEPGSFNEVSSGRSQTSLGGSRASLSASKAFREELATKLSAVSVTGEGSE